jgi:hypothetical protein
MESDLLSVTGTLEAWGITPIVSPVMPAGRNFASIAWWSSTTEEPIRALYNKWVLSGAVPGAKVIDLCEAFPGDVALTSLAATNWTLFDGNGIHPIGQANAFIANYVNSALSAKDRIYKTEPDIEDNAKEFSSWVQFDQGIQTTATSTLTTPLLSATALQAGQSLAYWMGSQLAYFDALEVAFYQDGIIADPANMGIFSVYNGLPITVNGNGLVTVGLSFSQALANTSGASLTVGSALAQTPIYAYNTNTAGEIMMKLLQPSLSTGQQTLQFLGTALSTNNSAALLFSNAGGNGSNSNFFGLDMFGFASQLNLWGSGDVTVNSTSDSGYTLYVNGTLKVTGTMAAPSFSLSGTTYTPKVSGTTLFWSTP